MTKVSILALLDFEKLFVMEYDASHIRIGAIFSQDGKVVEFFSEKLFDVKRYYSTYNLKFYTLLRAVPY